MSCEYKLSVEPEKLEDAVHDFLADGKIPVAIPVVFHFNAQNQLVPALFKLLVYDPKQFERRKQEREMQRAIGWVEA